MTEKQVRELLNKMTVKEKINQMFQVSGHLLEEEKGDIVVTGPLEELGLKKTEIPLIGSSLGLIGAKKIKEYQKKFMEAHPNKIPHLFMLDVINGFRTIFPIPLGQGATFAPELSKKCAKIAAKESAVSGIHVTFAPMVDLVRDARWGRVMESTGEDPWLNAQFSKAMVEGFQGDCLKDEYSIGACIKHFAAYGAVESGKEYNTVELSEHTLREAYFPSYQTGIEAGAALVMTAFNTINGVPASVNKWLMKDILREEMGFDGVLISDYAAVGETIAHGCCADMEEAAKRAIESGVDIEMMSNAYVSSLETLIENDIVPEDLLNESVYRILQLKNKLGLFENPYKDADEQKEKELILCEEHRKVAREVAAESFVLLKNEDILPLKEEKKVAFIGPYTSSHSIMGSWSFIGDVKDTITIKEAAKSAMKGRNVSFHKGCPMYRVDDSFAQFSPNEQESVMTKKEEEALLQQAIQAAKEADVVVMPIGESYLQSGESMSRAMIEIPEAHMNLFREIYKVNENIVVVLFNGRPLDLRELKEKAKAILEVWFPGTEGGNAILDVLLGKRIPSGKLPMSFPYCVGQVPVYYNHYTTGRPFTGADHEDRYRSKYLDIPNEPLYPFGYGLTYTTFQVSDISLDKTEMTKDDTITATVSIKNIGNMAGKETIQMYIQDVSSSIVRPVKELRGYQKVMLQPKEERELSFTIKEEDLRFVLPDHTWGSEKGKFRVFIGQDSSVKAYKEFYLI